MYGTFFVTAPCLNPVRWGITERCCDVTSVGKGLIIPLIRGIIGVNTIGGSVTFMGTILFLLCGITEWHPLEGSFPLTFKINRVTGL